MKWDVLLFTRRYPKAVGYDVETEELWSYVAACFDEGACGLTRADLPPDTWKYRVSELIDVAEGEDKNGNPITRRSVRYGKIDKRNKKTGLIQNKKMSMADWDLLVKMNSWVPKPKSKEELKADGKAVTTCRNGDDLCACLVLDRQCRLETEEGVPSPRRE